MASRRGTGIIRPCEHQLCDWDQWPQSSYIVELELPPTLVHINGCDIPLFRVLNPAVVVRLRVRGKNHVSCEVPP
jgi:hypothetical protein